MHKTFRAAVAVALAVAVGLLAFGASPAGAREGVEKPSIRKDCTGSRATYEVYLWQYNHDELKFEWRWDNIGRDFTFDSVPWVYDGNFDAFRETDPVLLEFTDGTSTADGTITVTPQNNSCTVSVQDESTSGGTQSSNYETFTGVNGETVVASNPQSAGAYVKKGTREHLDYCERVTGSSCGTVSNPDENIQTAQDHHAHWNEFWADPKDKDGNSIDVDRPTTPEEACEAAKLMYGLTSC